MPTEGVKESEEVRPDMVPPDPEEALRAANLFLFIRLSLAVKQQEPKTFRGNKVTVKYEHTF